MPHRHSTAAPQSEIERGSCGEPYASREKKQSLRGNRASLPSTYPPPTASTLRFDPSLQTRAQFRLTDRLAQKPVHPGFFAGAPVFRTGIGRDCDDREWTPFQPQPDTAYRFEPIDA